MFRPEWMEWGDEYELDAELLPKNVRLSFYIPLIDRSLGKIIVNCFSNAMSALSDGMVTRLRSVARHCYFSTAADDPSCVVMILVWVVPYSHDDCNEHMIVMSRVLRNFIQFRTASLTLCSNREQRALGGSHGPYHASVLCERADEGKLQLGGADDKRPV